MKVLLVSVAVSIFIGCQQQREQNKGQEKSDTTSVTPTSPLPSWNDAAAKKAIIDFITLTTKEGGADFIPVEQRIACFDNDGTLWSEQPLYFQFLFALDRVKELAPQHPEWKIVEPFKSLLSGDMKNVMAGGEKSLIKIVAATHAGMSTDEFETAVKNWISTATHPRFNKHYNELIYQPMLELLTYLRENDFKTYIVSGGDQQFMRVWAEQAYGIHRSR